MCAYKYNVQRREGDAGVRARLCAHVRVCVCRTGTSTLCSFPTDKLQPQLKSYVQEGLGVVCLGWEIRGDRTQGST